MKTILLKGGMDDFLCSVLGVVFLSFRFFNHFLPHKKIPCVDYKIPCVDYKLNTPQEDRFH